jgi:hypothetical protein
MYNRDQSILYYYTINERYFINYLNINILTLEKHLNKGTYYIGKYLFTREFEPSAIIKEMSILEVALMLDKDKKKLFK